LARSESFAGLRRVDTDPPLAEFVLAMTKSMLRSGYYSSAHPEGQKALAGLHASLHSNMEARGPELSFELARVDAKTEDVIVFDGVGRVRLMSALLGEGAARTFVPKLVEYFHRQELLSFSLSATILRPHFDAFIERMTRPASGNRPHAGEALSKDLAKAGVRGVSVVFDEDRIRGLGADVPWRAELALTRLRKDLRMIPMLANATVREMHDVKVGLMGDIMRGVTEASLVVAIARYLPDALTDQQKLMPLDDAQNNLVRALDEALLAPAALELLEPWIYFDDDPVEADTDWRNRARLIALVSGRLSKRKDPESRAAMVRLHEADFVSLDALPQEARDTIRGNALADAALTSPERLIEALDHSEDADPFAGIIHDLEIAGEALIERESWPAAAEVVHELWEYARGEMVAESGDADLACSALERVASETHQAKIAEAIAAADEVPKACADIIKCFDRTVAVDVLVRVLAIAERRPTRMWAVDEIVEWTWEAPELVAGHVVDLAKPWFVTRNLLLALRKVGQTDHYPALATLLEHEQQQVRTEALLTMARLDPARAQRMIHRALGDNHAEMRRAGAVAMGGATDPAEPPVRLLLEMLRSDREQEGVRLQVAASLGHVAALGPHAICRDEILDALRSIITDKYGSAMHRLKRFAKSKHLPSSSLLSAVCAALGAVGDPYDEPLLETCLEDEALDVRESATAAIGRLRDQL